MTEGGFQRSWKGGRMRSQISEDGKESCQFKLDRGDKVIRTYFWGNRPIDVDHVIKKLL